MNDFPMPEDPPVMTTAENCLRAVSGEGIGNDRQFFAGGVVPSVQGTTKIKATAMNRQNHPELIVSGIHLELTPSLKTFVQEKADRLFRHEERILRMRVELESDPKERFGARFKAKGHVIIDGPALNASVESDECHKAVALLADKLDRMLSRRAQLLKVKRHHPHAIEFGAPLPKAI
jgi:putative sigma-54 modulation protein